MSYTAGDVLNLAAPLLNDRNKTRYTDEVMLPYLRIASDELDLEFHNENIESHNAVCDIAVDIGEESLTLPCRFFLPIRLYERLQTSTNDDDFTPMTERSFEPNATAVSSLDVWAFRQGAIKFVGALTDRTVRLHFKQSLGTLVDEDAAVTVSKAKNFLSFRTAALCAEFIGRNTTISNGLNAQAAINLDALTTAYVKNRQGVRVRRRPFRLRGAGRYVRVGE